MTKDTLIEESLRVLNGPNRTRLTKEGMPTQRSHVELIAGSILVVRVGGMTVEAEMTPANAKKLFSSPNGKVVAEVTTSS